jgi:hypothetical protein
VNLPENWLNTWHHIAGVCDGTSLRVYIDGKLAGTTNLGVPVNLSVTAKWTLGRNEEFPSERIFTGFMDQVGIFSSALPAEEIKTIVDSRARPLAP